MVVPEIGGLAQIAGAVGVVDAVGDVGGGEQGGDLDGKREGREAAILLPAILAGHRPVLHDEPRSAAHHRPEAVQLVVAERAFAPEQIDQQDRKGAFVHLHAGPIGAAVEPAILRPMTVGLLRRLEPAQHPPGVGKRAAGRQAAGGLDEIARPDEVIAAEILVALVEPPGDRQAGDHAAGKRARLMAAQHRGADAIGVVGVAGIGGVEAQQPVLPGAPPRDILRHRRGKAVIEAAPGAMRRLARAPAESQRQQELAAAGGEINLGGERDIAVARLVVAPGHGEMARQILPAIGDADKSHRARAIGRRAGERQRVAAAPGKQHWEALEVVEPGGVAGAAIDEMRRQQGVKPVITEAALQRAEDDALQHHLAPGIGKDGLVDAEAAVARGVGERETRHALGELAQHAGGIALFLGEIVAPIGDDEAEIAGAGVVDAGIIDLVEDAVAEGEPDPALGRERGADAALGARGPARGNARRARRRPLEAGRHHRTRRGVAP